MTRKSKTPTYGDPEARRKRRAKRRAEILARRAHLKAHRDPKTGHLRGGNFGNKGGGRKPEDFVRLCQGLSYRAMQRKVRRILRQPDHPHFMQALKLSSAYGWGQPKQSVEVSGTLTLEQLVAGSRRHKEEK